MQFHKVWYRYTRYRTEMPRPESVESGRHADYARFVIGGMSEGPTDGDREAIRDALSVLAHDIRLDILLALLEGWAGVHTEPQRYSDLMDAVGMEDSGKFNYHLDRLRGVYVERVEGGYAPTAGATALYRAVLAHQPTEETDRAGELDETCPNCGGSVLERHERSFLTYECADCEDWPGVTYSFPANGLGGRTASERRQAMSYRAGYHIGLARTGQCPFCAGRVQVEFDPRSDWADSEESPVVALACDTCTWQVVTGVLTPLQFEPRVAGALTRVDIDPPVMELPGVETRVERVSAGPTRRAVSVDTDGGSLRVVVDDSLGVHSVDSVTES